MVKTKKEKASSGNWPKVVVGSHLTVTTYDNGKTDLEWDWEALRRDVEEATSSVKKIDLVKETEAKVKKTRAKKTEVTTQITDAVTTKPKKTKKTK